MRDFALNILEAVKEIKNFIAGEDIYTLVEKKESSESINNKNTFNSLMPWQKELFDLKSQTESCYLCGLSRNRMNVVFSSGNPSSNIMLIGEAPGKQEDIKGEAFVGDAGKLLDKMLLAVGLKRDDVYIANVIKCRPPENRDPKPEEIEVCSKYLFKQIESVAPDIILCLGRHASHFILKSDAGLNELRERNFSNDKHSIDICGKKITVIATFHPAALLYNSQLKRPSWEDMKAFKVEYLKIGLKKK
jgi:DNA polymerase